MARLIVTLLFTLVFVNVSRAQQVHVIDRSSREGISSAYIAVGDKILGTADSLGFFNLDKYPLNDGDTVWASSLGMYNNYAIFKERKNSITILLETNAFIEQITVRYRDRSIPEFKDHVKVRMAMDWYLTYTGDYAIDFGEKGVKKGKFVYNTLPEVFMVNEDEHLKPIEIESETPLDSLELKEVVTTVRGFLSTAIISGSTIDVPKKIKDAMRNNFENPSPPFILEVLLYEKLLGFNDETFRDPRMRKTEYQEVALPEGGLESGVPGVAVMLPRGIFKEDVIPLEPFVTDQDMDIKYRGLDSSGKTHVFLIDRPYFVTDTAFKQKYETLMYVNGYSLEVDSAKTFWIDEAQRILVVQESNYDYNRRSNLYAYRYPLSAFGELYVDYGGENPVKVDVALFNIDIERCQTLTTFHKNRPIRLPFALPKDKYNVLHTIF